MSPFQRPVLLLIRPRNGPLYRSW